MTRTAPTNIILATRNIHTMVRSAQAVLAQCRTISDAKSIRDRAEALRHFAQQAGESLEVQNACAEIKLRAERKAGELLQEMEKSNGGRPPKTGNRVLPVSTLRDIGISRIASSRWQQIAQVPTLRFESHIATTKEAKEELTTASVLELARLQAREHRMKERQRHERSLPIPKRCKAHVQCHDSTRPWPVRDIDLIVTSPPYGVGIAYPQGGDIAPDCWPSFMEAWLQQAFLASSPQGRLALNVPLDTTAGGYRPTYALAVHAALLAGWTYRFSIVWHEDNVSRSVARGSFASASAPHIIDRVEMIAVFHKGKWKRAKSQNDADGRVYDDILHNDFLSWTHGDWSFPGEGRAHEDHPAAFPLELPTRLIKLLSFVGDSVCDPFCGSGTTLVAAVNSGRKAIGFDLSSAYVKSSIRRVQRSTN